MTPTILARDGQLVAVVGSPGGRTIINSVLQVILNLVDFDMEIDEAVSAKRFHHQWLPDRIRVEESGLAEAAVVNLESMGHTVDLSGSQGRTHCIRIDPATGERVGAPDLRDPDAGAAGY
jgi:gamma-glutamyltranspeptidase/glutathione hydrolase